MVWWIKSLFKYRKKYGKLNIIYIYYNGLNRTWNNLNFIIILKLNELLLLESLKISSKRRVHYNLRFVKRTLGKCFRAKVSLPAQETVNIYFGLSLFLIDLWALQFSKILFVWIWFAVKSVTSAQYHT